jgi:predicted amino acid-binding ACT domain protein
MINFTNSPKHTFVPVPPAMLPPQQTDTKGLPTSQFSALKDSISQVIRSELMPLRVLVECSAKEIDVRLLKLEDRLATALEPHSSQMARSNNCIEDVNTKKKFNVNQGSDNFAGKLKLRNDLKWILQRLT